MAWFRVDDHMVAHPVGGVVGDAALGYWMRLGCWLAQFPKQGDFIPHAVAVHLLHAMPRRRTKLKALIAAGLLMPDGDGYRMYPFMDLGGSGLPDRMWDLDSPQGRRRPIPTALRFAVYERDHFTCVHCGTAEALSLDHIHPFSRGGEDTFDNLQTLCRSCNSRKGARV